MLWSATFATQAELRVDFFYTTTTTITTMAANTTTTTTPADSRARPTAAPGVEDEVYVTPPQMIESSSSSDESTASELVCGVQGLSFTKALNKFLVQTEMNPGKTGRFWKEDEMRYVHSMFCPQWVDLLRQHCLVHSLSGSPQATEATQTVKVLKFMHTSAKTDFTVSAIIELSNARISASRCLILGIMIDEDYVIEHGSLAENGYSTSTSITIGDVNRAGVSLQSCIHLSSSIVDALKSDAVTTITRCSISQYECMMEVNVFSELGMVSSENLIALSMQTPHSVKVRCTLATQTPELFSSKLMNSISIIKGEGIKENGTQAVNATQTVSATQAVSANFGIQLTDGDEVTVTIKKMKRN
eukprot:16754-Amphidinium_carterae.1